MSGLARVLGPLYHQAPKAVLAAVLVHVLAGPEGDYNAVPGRLRAVWTRLHRAGLLLKGPPKREEQ